MRKPHAASHLPALYPYSFFLCCNNKAGQAVWVWGPTKQQELLWGWTWRRPDFICYLSILRLWKFSSPDLFCSIIFGKIYRIYGRCFKVSSYSPTSPSAASQGKSEPAFKTKIFWLYRSPWFYYSSVVVTKGVAVGDLLNRAGKKQRHRWGKRMNQVLLSGEGQVSQAPRLNGNQTGGSKSQALRESARKQENFLSPLSTCHIS